MTIINKLTTLMLLMFYSLTSMAQVGIGTSTPNANSALEIVSTSQGMLLPRMTSTQRDAIASPSTGLTIFNTDLNCIQTNTGTSSAANWKCLGISTSTNGSAVVSAYSCSTASAGTLIVGTPVSGVTQTITATVGTAGTYSISTTTANGVTFAGSGIFAGTGAQDIVLTATGTPTAAGTNSFTLNTSPNCSFSRTTITVPDAPTSPVATAGSASASVAFTAPASNGGSVITSYTATSSPGGFTGTLIQAGSGTITVTGLTNGTAYTFTVVATNVAGNSLASTASAAVTPGPQLGSTYTAYSNGTENFSANTLCDDKLISAQGCGGLTTVTGASNTVYDLVNINGQCWMTTNLNEVPSNFSMTITYSYLAHNGWSGVYTGGPFTNEGRLYQWRAAMNNSTTERAQGACPSGFHVPSDCEWKYLEHGQGMSISNQNASSSGFRNIGSVGSKLSTLTSSGTNSSGFTALLAGYRPVGMSSTFSSRGTSGYWWSSSFINSSGFYRSLASNQAGVTRYFLNMAGGLSVRCLKD